MPSMAGDATQLTIRLGQGDADAAARLIPTVYEQLRTLAAAHLRRERRDHTLQPTALAHEAFLKLVDATQIEWQGKAQFLALAAEQIRRVLVEHARRRNAAKRGGLLHRTRFPMGLDCTAP